VFNEDGAKKTERKVVQDQRRSVGNVTCERRSKFDRSKEGEQRTSRNQRVDEGRNAAFKSAQSNGCLAKFQAKYDTTGLRASLITATGKTYIARAGALLKCGRRLSLVAFGQGRKVSPMHFTEAKRVIQRRRLIAVALG